MITRTQVAPDVVALSGALPGPGGMVVPVTTVPTGPAFVPPAQEFVDAVLAASAGAHG